MMSKMSAHVTVETDAVEADEFNILLQNVCSRLSLADLERLKYLAYEMLREISPPHAAAIRAMARAISGRDLVELLQQSGFVGEDTDGFAETLFSIGRSDLLKAIGCNLADFEEKYHREGPRFPKFALLLVDLSLHFEDPLPLEALKKHVRCEHLPDDVFPVDTALTLLLKMHARGVIRPANVTALVWTMQALGRRDLRERVQKYRQEYREGNRQENRQEHRREYRQEDCEQANTQHNGTETPDPLNEDWVSMPPLPQDGKTTTYNFNNCHNLHFGNTYIINNSRGVRQSVPPIPRTFIGVRVPRPGTAAVMPPPQLPPTAPPPYSAPPPSYSVEDPYARAPPQSARLCSGAGALESYPMTSQPRGTCVLIWNKEFQRDTNLPPSARPLEPRAGAEIDANNLRLVFTKLGFNVLDYKNRTRVEMLHIIKYNAQQAAGDCFVMCVLSHGRNNSVFSADEHPMHIREFTEPYQNDRCPAMAGKPKLFFIQACQGQGRQEAVPLDASNMATSMPVPDRLLGRLEMDQSAAADHVTTDQPAAPDHLTTEQSAASDHVTTDHPDNIETDSTVNLPQETVGGEHDFLIGFATVQVCDVTLKLTTVCSVTLQGCVSFRDKRDGSWYISKLTEMLDKYHQTEDILSILTKVSDDIAKHGNARFSGSETIFKQTPSVLSTLRKKLYFR